MDVNNLLVLLARNGSVENILSILKTRMLESTEMTVSPIDKDFSLFIFIRADKTKGYSMLEFMRSQMSKLKDWFAIEADNLISASSQYPKMLKMYSSEKGTASDSRNIKELNIDKAGIGTLYTLKDSKCSIEDAIVNFTSAWKELWGIPDDISGFVCNKVNEILDYMHMRCTNATFGFR